MIIPFLAVATALGVIVGLNAARRRPSSRAAPALPRKLWLLPVAILPQLLWTHGLSHLGPDAISFAWLLPLSYVPVLAFVALNVRYPWARVLAIGVALNFTVMVANGGTMPASARPAEGPPTVTHEVVRRAVPGSKDSVSAQPGPAFLTSLEDQYVVALPGGGHRLVSIGDFVSLGGAVLGLLSTL